jgi:hypothetical protein
MRYAAFAPNTRWAWVNSEHSITGEMTDRLVEGLCKAEVPE